jgi:hypothetical protein
LSLVEVALLLCIGAVILAVFVPTFLDRVRTNKISEAAEFLEEMHARAAAYYGAAWDDGKRLCLPPSAGPTPASPSAELIEVDFLAEDQAGHASWAALGFQPDRSLRYSYSYRPSADGCELGSGEQPSSVLFRAEGDLDGDGVLSTFERRASIDAEGLKPEGPLHVHRRVE